MPRRRAGGAASRAAASPGFDFASDLVRVGIANQTTMLSGESLAIAAEFRESMARRYGEAAVDEHFRTFDTICSATQERQDAVLAAARAEPPDLMVVVGGYNSSNTHHLADLCRAKGVRTLHIEDADCIDVATGAIRHQPDPEQPEETAEGWLEVRPRIGLTAGASTPNNKIGETMARICESSGVLVALRETLTPGG